MYKQIMKLSEYLKISGLTYEQFGCAIGCSGSECFRYAKGIHRPRKPRMDRIKEVTLGAVQANDFYTD